MAIMVTCLAETGRTLWLRRELDGAGRRWWEKQRSGNGWGRRRRPGFIVRPRNTETTRSSLPMPAQSRRWPRARLEDGGSSPTVRAGLLSLFTIFTELPLDPFLKLLSNLYGNSKISKNKSCSKIKVLQLWFNNHTQIMSTFWNASLKSKGDTLRIYPFSKYFKFFITTLKTLKTNFVLLTSSTLFLLGSTPKCA